MRRLAAPEFARRIADALEAAGVPHAIGGALALGVWGFPLGWHCATDAPSGRL